MLSLYGCAERKKASRVRLGYSAWSTRKHVNSWYSPSMKMGMSSRGRKDICCGAGPYQTEYPPQWYTMCLCFHSTYPPDGPPCYRWVVHTAHEVSGHAGQGRLDLNVMFAIINDRLCTAMLCNHAEDEIFTPEPVQCSRGTAARPATVFYPDAGL